MSAAATPGPAAGLLPATPGGFRDRLLLGMADAIREHGDFRSVTVAEVVRRARTSRRTFYQHFDDREACFLALFDVVSEGLLTTIAEAATGEGPFGDRVDRAMAAYLGALAAEPVLARSCIEEAGSVGPDGTARVRAMNERWARQTMRLVEEAREHDDALRPLPFEVATIITGGFRDLVITTLDEGRDLTELQDVASDVFRRITMR
ncbi:MAG TPA: TetR/AcrR family transcriptional regulator [Baekduia sp.]|uniref:TetR/AcrR family transcriptional regulator n=1 Tax=Baekduia sp. TaxID=2600305 RepID=UPI002B8E432B|nr:TetR/AcrR family transcriptional regulator [Baekduia sp.]HMJ32793.1 TetR/AcrR family transcriptional regulator [Baekduia sp.]